MYRGSARQFRLPLPVAVNADDSGRFRARVRAAGGPWSAWTQVRRLTRRTPVRREAERGCIKRGRHATCPSGSSSSSTGGFAPVIVSPLVRLGGEVVVKGHLLTGVQVRGVEDMVEGDAPPGDASQRDPMGVCRGACEGCTASPRPCLQFRLGRNLTSGRVSQECVRLLNVKDPIEIPFGC
jgi:hypothetical protein